MMMGSDHDEHAEQPADGESAAEAAMSEPAAETQVGELQERLLRVQAELENFRKRSRREYEDAQRYREIDVLRDLLPVLDNVLRAIEAAEKAVDVGSLRSGFRMAAQQIERLLAGPGCQTIETDGAAFDPAVHDAILQQEVPGVAAGTIVGTASRGYKLHDRVVRPAQVIVAKGG